MKVDSHLRRQHRPLVAVLELESEALPPELELVPLELVPPELVPPEPEPVELELEALPPEHRHPDPVAQASA
jgi:hypothetical protein